MKMLYQKKKKRQNFVMDTQTQAPRADMLLSLLYHVSVY
jgi:hypothetical protein